MVARNWKILYPVPDVWRDWGSEGGAHMTITDLQTEIDRMIADNNDPAALGNLGTILQVKGEEAIRKAVEIVLKKGGRAA